MVRIGLSNELGHGTWIRSWMGSDPVTVDGVDGVDGVMDGVRSGYRWMGHGWGQIRLPVWRLDRRLRINADN